MARDCREWVGKRVSVPQALFGFDDDEPFYFQGTIALHSDDKVMVLFDYTQETLWFSLDQARPWIQHLVDDMATLFSSL